MSDISSGAALRIIGEMAQTHHDQHLAAHMDTLAELATVFVPVVIHRRIDPIVRFFAPKWIASKAAAKQNALFLKMTEHIAQHRRLNESIEAARDVMARVNLVVPRK